MSKEFENELLSKGFILSNSEYFICKCNNKSSSEEKYTYTYTWYYQQCRCCLDSSYIREHNMSKYLEWYKCTSCDECLENEIGCLFCGGHYENFRIFNDKNSIKVEMNLLQYELDPTHVLTEEENDIGL